MAKLTRLSDRAAELKRRQGGWNKVDPKKLARAQGLGAGMRIGVELVAAVVVGGVLGYLLDGWLGTRPLFMVIFLLIGMAAGFLTVYRTAKELERRAREEKAKAAPAADPD